MSRKDIIIISVLVNAGLLAVLFVTALKTDPQTISAALSSEQQVNSIVTNDAFTKVSEIAINDILHEDEVDLVLKDYLPDAREPQIKEIEEPLQPLAKIEEPPFQGEYVEIVVKSGDALEKIARANRTTVDAIRKANGLQNDRLRIGQALKVPVGLVKEEVKSKKIVPSAPQATLADSPAYYVVKPGDNPWKIAKLHHVKFEDLLTLNNLDEERARNLKVGEKIRVR